MIWRGALEAVRNKVKDQERTALLVKKAELRPLIRKMIEPEFPDMPVLSRQELLPELENKVADVVDLLHAI